MLSLEKLISLKVRQSFHIIAERVSAYFLVVSFLRKSAFCPRMTNEALDFCLSSHLFGGLMTVFPLRQLVEITELVCLFLKNPGIRCLIIQLICLKDFLKHSVDEGFDSSSGYLDLTYYCI